MLILNLAQLNLSARISAAFVNFSGSVGRINLILFVLDSVNQAPSFNYNKHIIKDLNGGRGLILAARLGKNEAFLEKSYLLKVSFFGELH
jgi:hypothetical protein